MFFFLKWKERIHCYFSLERLLLKELHICRQTSKIIMIKIFKAKRCTWKWRHFLILFSFLITCMSINYLLCYKRTLAILWNMCYPRVENWAKRRNVMKKILGREYRKSVQSVTLTMKIIQLNTTYVIFCSLFTTSLSLKKNVNRNSRAWNYPVQAVQGSEETEAISYVETKRVTFVWLTVTWGFTVENVIRAAY